MPTQSRCPARDTFQSFVSACLDEQQAEELIRHLEICPDCEGTVSELEREDTLADCIQAAHRPLDPETGGFIKERECEQLLQTYSYRSSHRFLGKQSSQPQSSQPQSSQPQSSQPQSSQPQSIRDYDIIGLVGQGGMGTVYKAVHRRLKRKVALKVLPGDRFNHPEIVSRFEREMEALGRLIHPNIVQALDAGEQDGQHYLVMELVEGENLSELIRRTGPLRIADACSLTSQIASGLQFAYENGIVHRDIKPSNVMLASTASEPIAKILDLGLARALNVSANPGTDAEELTTTGQVMGTLDYMAPEQGGDPHKIDIRTDIYSLGATLYKLLTGESPFASHTKLSPMQRLMMMATTEPPSVRGKRADIPETLSLVIHRMLAKSPEDRFATPADVIHALKPYCQGADLSGLMRDRSTSQLTSLPRPQLSPEVTATSDSVQNRYGIPQPEINRAKRFPGKAVRVALAALLLLASGIFTIITKEGLIEVESLDGPLPQDLKIVVQQGGQDVGILQQDGNWKASVASGTITLSIEAGDDAFELCESSLTISRFGRNIVRVRTSPPKRSEDENSEHDRQIAKTILGLGGCVRVGPPNTPQDVWDGLEPNAIPQVYDVAELPDAPFWVYAVYVDFDSGNGPEIVQELVRLSHVAHILFHGNMTDNDLTVLEDVSDSVNVVRFDGCLITSASVKKISTWKSLRQLDLTNNHHIDDACVMQLTPLTGLQSIDLSGTAVTDHGIETLSHSLPGLVNVILDRLSITDDGIQHLAALSDFMSLRITDCPNVTGDGIERLRAKVPACGIQFNGEDFSPTHLE